MKKTLFILVLLNFIIVSCSQKKEPITIAEMENHIERFHNKMPSDPQNAMKEFQEAIDIKSYKKFDEFISLANKVIDIKIKILHLDRPNFETDTNSKYDLIELYDIHMDKVKKIEALKREQMRIKKQMLNIINEN